MFFYDGIPSSLAFSINYALGVFSALFDFNVENIFGRRVISYVVFPAEAQFFPQFRHDYSTCRTDFRFLWRPFRDELTLSSEPNIWSTPVGSSCSNVNSFRYSTDWRNFSGRGHFSTTIVAFFSSPLYFASMPKGWKFKRIIFFAISSALQPHFSKPSPNFSPWYSNTLFTPLSPIFPLKNELIEFMDATKRLTSLLVVFSGESLVTTPFFSQRKPQSLLIRISSLLMPVGFFLLLFNLILHLLCDGYPVQVSTRPIPWIVLEARSLQSARWSWLQYPVLHQRHATS